MGNLDKYGVDYYWLNLMLAYLAKGDREFFTKGMMRRRRRALGRRGRQEALTKLLEWRDNGYFNEDYPSINSDDPNADFLAGKIFACPTART